MFYRLTHIDGVPLPAVVPLDGRAVPVAGGGILLEPASIERPYFYPDGYSILWLHGGPVDEGLPDLVIRSSERYRWLQDDLLEIARPDNEPCLRFRGVRLGATLTLRSESAPEVLGGSELSFVEAGDEPIPRHWQGTLGPGPRRVIRNGPPNMDPEMLLRIAEHEAAQDAELVKRAAERLAVAWRARG